MTPISLLCLGSFPSQRANIGKVLLSRCSKHVFNALLEKKLYVNHIRNISTFIHVYLIKYIYIDYMLYIHTMHHFYSMVNITSLVSSKSVLLQQCPQIHNYQMNIPEVYH